MVPESVIRLMPEIGVYALAVYVVLADYAGDSGECWPSVARIAEITGMTDRSVRNQLRMLKSHGLITAESRVDGNIQQSNLYKLHSPQKPPESKARGGGTKSQGGRNEKPGAPGTKRQAPPERNARGTRTNEQEPLNKKKGADAFGIPECLNNDFFLAKWEEYIQHRKEKRSKLTPTAAKAVLRKLEAMGPAKAVEALNNSIGNGWVGVFEPNGKKNGKQPSEPNAAYEAGGKSEYGPVGVF